MLAGVPFVPVDVKATPMERVESDLPRLPGTASPDKACSG